MKIMIVDDEVRLCRVLGEVLGKAGYETVWACRSDEALLMVPSERPDLILLDVSMPGFDGVSLCEVLRARGVSVPIVFLTAKVDLADKERGFAAGADDYIAKPFDNQELVMRIGAHLRRESRAGQSVRDVLVRGPFQFDLIHQQLRKNGAPVEVTANEFRLLALLAVRPGEALTKQQIVRELWGDDFEGEVTSLPVYVRRAREKIEDDPSRPRYLQTVWHVGYRFCPDGEA